MHSLHFFVDIFIGKTNNVGFKCSTTFRAPPSPIFLLYPILFAFLRVSNWIWPKTFCAFVTEIEKRLPVFVTHLHTHLLPSHTHTHTLRKSSNFKLLLEGKVGLLPSWVDKSCVNYFPIALVSITIFSSTLTSFDVSSSQLVAVWLISKGYTSDIKTGILSIFSETRENKTLFLNIFQG